MRILPTLGITLLAITLTGCMSSVEQGSDKKPVSSQSATNTGSATEQPAAKPIQVYQLNEAAAAGEIVHTVTFVESLTTIPDTATIPTYDLIAAESPAADGFRWVHVKGTVLNTSKKSQTVNSLSFAILDANGNAYEPVTSDTILYVEENKVPVSLSVQPTQNVEWETYFLVPTDATELQLQATDLAYLPKDTMLIDLGL